MTAEEIIALLGLTPHPEEGGFFRETYRARGQISSPDLPPGTGGPRAHSTAIYYLLTPETFSEMHMLTSDEVFHFYAGDPVEQLQLDPDGAGRLVTLGADLAAGQRPQVLVPAGVWQGARLAAGGSWGLLGCTVSPGFDFADYTGGDAELASRWPAWSEAIRARLRS